MTCRKCKLSLQFKLIKSLKHFKGLCLGYKLRSNPSRLLRNNLLLTGSRIRVAANHFITDSDPKTQLSKLLQAGRHGYGSNCGWGQATRLDVCLTLVPETSPKPQPFQTLDRPLQYVRPLTNGVASSSLQQHSDSSKSWLPLLY